MFKIVRFLARVVMFALMLTMLFTAIYTVTIGAGLVLLTEDVIRAEHIASDSPEARRAANVTYEKVEEARNSIYNSDCKYQSWISTQSKTVQILTFVLLVFIPCIHFAAMNKDMKRRRARRARRANMNRARV